MNNKLVALVALTSFVAALAEPAAPRTETISTPSGSVTTTTRTIDPVPQEVTLASAAELRAFNKFALRAQDFVAAYLGAQAKPSLESLDEAFRRWQLETVRRFSEKEVIEILGSYLGNKLIAELKMEWVVVKDKDGRDYGVRSRTVEVLAYPFASVEKRVQRSQYDFMVGVFHAVEHSLKTGDHKARQR